MSDAHNMPSIKVLFIIIDWNKVNIVEEIFKEENVRFHFISRGKGTASSDVLNLLGLGTSEKAIIICLEQEELISIIIKDVTKKLGFHNPGAGIAFTVPLSGINQPIYNIFKEHINENPKIQSLKETQKMNNEYKYDLIITVINQGYSDELMSVAREAGATGGTVIHARGIVHEGPVKFFGISVQEEKEIIIIISPKETKTGIMHAVSESYGITSKAGGIVFSLPVDSVIGLNLDE